MRPKILIAILIALLMLLLVTPILGQPDGVDGAGPLRTLLDKRIAKVQEWRADAAITLALTLAVGLLGIASGALQIGGAKWIKPATAAIGVTISVLTLIQSEVYKFDRFTLDRAATRAERIIEDVELVLPQVEFVESPEDWQVFAELVNEKIDRIDVIEDQLKGFDVSPGGDQVATLLPGWIPAALAAERRPSWIDKSPTSRSELFFVGHAVDRSLRAAQQDSHDDAMEQAVAYFVNVTEEARGTARFDAEELSARIVETAEVESTYYEFHRELGGWRFYTLLRVARSAVDRSIEYFSIEQRQMVPESVVDEVRKAPAPETGYTGRRFEMQQQMMITAREAIPPELYAEFERARDLRRAGQVEPALEMLQGIVEQRPDFYLAWFNLALAREAMDRPEEAVEAFERAVALEREQSLDDASLYNSYGYLLYRMARYEEAIPLLERAVELAPDHLRAQNNLRSAHLALRGDG
jgi:hypothetical protein